MKPRMKKLGSYSMINGNSCLQPISKCTKNSHEKIKKLENKPRKDSILVEQTHTKGKGSRLCRWQYQSGL